MGHCVFLCSVVGFLSDSYRVLGKKGIGEVFAMLQTVLLKLRSLSEDPVHIASQMVGHGLRYASCRSSEL